MLKESIPEGCVPPTCRPYPEAIRGRGGGYLSGDGVYLTSRKEHGTRDTLPSSPPRHTPVKTFPATSLVCAKIPTSAISRRSRTWVRGGNVQQLGHGLLWGFGWGT